MRKPVVTIALFGVTAVLVVGCGDDNGGNGDAVEAGGGQGAASATIEAADFEFLPDELEGAPGETLTIEVENTGSSDHTFTGDDVDEVLEPGESSTVEVTLPESGEYAFHCRFHRAQGMTGAIIVTGSAPPATGSEEPAPTGGGGIPGY